jgi:Rrf2 family protein
VSLPDIVQATGAPQSFLSKVLQGLTHGGLITSRRGPAGGFEISATGSQASMREVIEAIDGPISLNVCLSETRSCPRQGWCPAHPVWARAQAAMLEVLGAAKIADLSSAPADTGSLTSQKTRTDH